jgi:hypothetical protein
VDIAAAAALVAGSVAFLGDLDEQRIQRKGFFGGGHAGSSFLKISVYIISFTGKDVNAARAARETHKYKDKR